MNVLTQYLNYPVKTVAFVDGVDDGPEMMLPYWYAEMDGYQTVHVPQPLGSIAGVVSFVQDHAQAVVCANRLDHLGSNHFSGAELAAALYDARIPTLLVTQYLDIDQHTSIRKWRSKLPVVLHLREFEPTTVKDYLEVCITELQGSIPEARVPFQVMLGIDDVDEMAGERYIDVSVGCWDHYQRVRLPVSLIPEHLHAHLAPGAWLFAHVNVRAKWSDELYFREFVRAPKPEYDEDLVYCVNVLDGVSMNRHLCYWFDNQRGQEQPFEVQVSDIDKKDMLN